MVSANVAQTTSSNNQGQAEDKKNIGHNTNNN